MVPANDHNGIYPILQNLEQPNTGNADVYNLQRVLKLNMFIDSAPTNRRKRISKAPIVERG